MRGRASVCGRLPGHPDDRGSTAGPGARSRPRACPTFLLLTIAMSAWGQSPRDEYRRNFQAWRQTEPTLESDAATAGGDLAARVQRTSAAARSYVAARIEFLESISREASDQVKRIQELSSQSLVAPSAEIQTTVTGAADTVTRVADSFGTAADAGIRQLRTALQQERTALDAISQAIANSRRSMAAATIASIDVDTARDELLRAYQGVAAARAQSAEQMRKSGTAWDAYYQALANPPVTGVSSNAIAPVKPVAAAPKAGATPAPAAPDAEVVRPPTITPLPLLRYTGGWTFPTNGIFHGTQPDSVDLTVREENGHVTGIFYARFRIAAGAADPVVQFNFEGNLTANRNQLFNLRTGEGVAGTIELIPGPAFNLLEVNFQTEMRPNRIRSGNFLLVKK